MQILKKTQPSHNVDKQMFNAAGVLLQFLASPEEVGDAICLIRGTMPPGVVLPLQGSNYYDSLLSSWCCRFECYDDLLECVEIVHLAK